MLEKISNKLKQKRIEWQRAQTFQSIESISDPRVREEVHAAYRRSN